MPVMRPQPLPPEIWARIVSNVENSCFAWFVLRRVSPFLRQVTEDVFAAKVIRSASISFSAQVSFGDEWMLDLEGIKKEKYYNDSRDSLVAHNGTFKFKAVAFYPSYSKNQVIFKLKDFTVTTGRMTSIFSEASPDKGFTKTRMEEHFFELIRSARTTRFDQVSQFVRIGDDLRSIKLLGINFNIEKKEVALDWRALCQSFYYHDLKFWRVSFPRLREFAAGLKVYPLQAFTSTEIEEGKPFERKELGLDRVFGYRGCMFLNVSVEDCKRYGWIFWDVPREDVKIILVA